jgi:hypothetical protein
LIYFLLRLLFLFFLLSSPILTHSLLPPSSLLRSLFPTFVPNLTALLPLLYNCSSLRIS